MSATLNITAGYRRDFSQLKQLQLQPAAIRLRCVYGRHANIAPQRQPQCRSSRLLPSAAAGSNGGPAADSEPDSPEAAFKAVQSCMELFMTRKDSSDLDNVVEFLPEAVIDRLLERKAAKRREEAGQPLVAQQQLQQPQQSQQQQQEDELGQSLSFEELVSLAQPSDLALDAFSARGVLNAVPRSASVLSSLKLAPDRFLQRYAVVAQSGEEMVLTFDMQLEEALVPKYRGLQVTKRWFLKGIIGESAYPGDAPTRPEPCWGPEAVVQAQLAALQGGDVAAVFQFASPRNRTVTGPVERFAQMLQAPLYRPLLHHLSADVLRTVQMKPDTAVLIVGVCSNLPTSELGVTQRVVYSWTVRLQGAAAEEHGGCWLVDSVQPISQNLFSL